METLVPSITSLIEVLCAFFFFISFASFKRLMLSLLEYEKWKKALVIGLSDKAKDLIDSLKEYLHLNLPSNVRRDIINSRQNLIEHYKNYLTKVNSIDIRSTYFFSRVSFICGMYCMTILIVASLPIKDYFTGIFYYNIFFTILVSIFSYVDYRIRWWKENKWRKIVKLILFEFTHLKAGFLLILFFVIFLSNSFFQILDLSMNIWVWLYTISFYTPLLVILVYSSFYLFQYRHFRIQVRRFNVQLLAEIEKVQLDYEKAIYARETVINLQRPKN